MGEEMVMRLSTTVNFFIPPYSSSKKACAEELKRYKNLGFENLDAIFCSAGNADSFLRKADWEDRIHHIADTAAELGITFVQSHIPFYNFYLKPAGTPDDIDEIVDRSIISAGILGAPWTVAHPATALGNSMPFIVSKQVNLEYFKRRLEVCEKHHVGLAIENMADFEGGGRNRWYCAHVEELCDLIDTLNQNTGLVGACWDFGHANLVYADQKDCLRMLGNRLKVTHVHDNNGTGDDHLSPFRGTVNWPDIMHTLAEIGYAHDFSFEVRRILASYVPEEIKGSLWRHLKVVGEYLLSLYEDALKDVQHDKLI